jgi:hypothetical protein
MFNPLGGQVYERDKVQNLLAAFPEARPFVKGTLGIIDELYAQITHDLRLGPMLRTNADAASELGNLFRVWIDDVVFLSASRSLRTQGDEGVGEIPIKLSDRAITRLIEAWEDSQLDHRLEAVGALNILQGVQFHSEDFWVNSRYALRPGDFAVILVAIAMLLKFTLLGDEAEVKRFRNMIDFFRSGIPLGSRLGDKKTWLVLTA